MFVTKVYGLRFSLIAVNHSKTPFLWTISNVDIAALFLTPQV